MTYMPLSDWGNLQTSRLGTLIAPFQVKALTQVEISFYDKTM